VVTAPPGGCLGVHVAAGTAYLAQVQEDGQFVDGVDTRSLSWPEYDNRSAAAKDYLARTRQMLRSCRSGQLAILNTRKYKNWEYVDAVSRVSIETCLMIAAAEESWPVAIVTHEHAAKVLGVEGRSWSSSDLTAAVNDRVATRPSAWSGKRSLAYVAAVVALADAGKGLPA
jgi:hypothetical protein